MKSNQLNNQENNLPLLSDETVTVVVEEREKGVSNLKLGQFKVRYVGFEGKKSYHVINPLTQKELSEGWKLRLPKVNKRSVIHHFSVHLSQLPYHLWKRVRTYSDEDGNDCYSDINDNIYKYNVRYSKYDTLVRELGAQVMGRVPDMNYVRSLYNRLVEHRVKGWVMLRARRVLGLDTDDVHRDHDHDHDHEMVENQ
jgi:hypothetical protein